MRVERWGDGLAVRLLPEEAERLGLAEGDAVEVTPLGGRAVDRPGDRREPSTDLDLAELRDLARPAPPG